MQLYCCADRLSIVRTKRTSAYLAVVVETDADSGSHCSVHAARGGADAHDAHLVLGRHHHTRVVLPNLRHLHGRFWLGTDCSGIETTAGKPRLSSTVSMEGLMAVFLVRTVPERCFWFGVARLRQSQRISNGRLPRQTPRRELCRYTSAEAKDNRRASEVSQGHGLQISIRYLAEKFVGLEVAGERATAELQRCLPVLLLHRLLHLNKREGCPSTHGVSRDFYPFSEVQMNLRESALSFASSRIQASIFRLGQIWSRYSERRALSLPGRSDYLPRYPTRGTNQSEGHTCLVR